MYDLGGTIKVEMLLHSFLETEETLLKSGYILSIGKIRMMQFRVFLIVILDNMEAAFVHIEVEVAFLEIRGSSFPDNSFRVQLLYCSPDCLPYAPTLYAVLHVQEIQVMMMCFRIDLNDCTADDTAVLYGSISHTSCLAG